MAAPLITIAEARELVLNAARPLGTERVTIGEAAHGRVLAHDLTAAGDVPPFACSAMDGYAITGGESGRTLTVVGESRAGTPAPRPLSDDGAIRISTGAAIPDGSTAVIPQENVEVRDGTILTVTAVEEGDHIRHAGEDMRAGETVLEAGTTLGGAELGAAVAAGAAELTVYRRPRVQVLSTGDELRAPGEPLGPGEIHNSNAPMLDALATADGAVTTTPQRLPDDRAATEQGLAAALETNDVVIVTGGVSVGPHDHVKPALAALGVEEVFWRVALQPGKPTWFGRRGSTLVFGLPGNPVSAVVTFSLFVRPALAALQGRREDRVLDSEAVLGTAVRRNPDREQAVRVRLERRNGALVATPNGPQGSHIVTSLLGADALAFIPRGEGELEAGAAVALAPLPH
ncbi:MAG TPA: gephyrin-like molybdotransferase Glp [Solirubrobacteraceae bacterium]|nr:gephyrin-like molybdotransferase Glp [Solirubrobacteraceae bacterium]